VKKPSNYISLPYLGLTAENLRDAYIEGSLDALQTLPPMERIYTNVTEGDFADRASAAKVHKLLVAALGQERKGIKGKAKNVKKLFDNVRRFCNPRRIDVRKLITDVKTIEGLSTDDLSELMRIATEPEVGIEQKKSGDTYRIRIGKKSDPEMAVAGNDTASCMPFGSGKNNVYMFNPNCVQLVLERQLSDGSWRTAAQSVLTIDHKTKRTTKEMLRAYEEHRSLSELVEPEDFTNQPVIACDNIEIAKNEEGGRGKNIKAVYERFFEEYLAENAERLGVDRTRVVIGMGYTPSALGLRQEENHYIPQAPMGYSDNTHENCRVEFRPLTVRDAITAAYLESRAYADNQSLMEYLHKIQNNIIGAQIANQYFQRPNLSFIAKDENGAPLGYMVAYEGQEGGEAAVYISDLAADPKNSTAGPTLVRKFIRTYFDSYGTDDKPFIPIFTNAREKTTYKWILKLTEMEAKKRGAAVELVEVGTYSIGQDTMHNVYIVVGRDKQEVEDIKVRLRKRDASAGGYSEDKYYSDEEPYNETG